MTLEQKLAHLIKSNHIALIDGMYQVTKNYDWVNNTSGLYFTNHIAQQVCNLANRKNINPFIAIARDHCIRSLQTKSSSEFEALTTFLYRKEISVENFRQIYKATKLEYEQEKKKV
jgi:hypothetical protein